VTRFFTNLSSSSSDRSENNFPISSLVSGFIELSTSIREALFSSSVIWPYSPTAISVNFFMSLSSMLAGARRAEADAVDP